MIADNLALQTFGHVTKNIAKVTGLYLVTAIINKQLKESTGELSELATQGIRRLRSTFKH